MLSLVNYGASDSENEITDEEDDQIPRGRLHGAQPENDIDDLILQTKSSTIQLPKPATVVKTVIEEEEDEFLHKKEVPVAAPPKKGKVKIMIPRLSEFKDDDDDKKSETKIQPANRKTGLLSMLPRPSRSFAPAPKPATSSSQPSTSSSQPSPAKVADAKTSDVPKKVGLIPYSLMSHKPKTAEDKKATKKKEENSDDDDEEPTGSFFTFADDESALPHVSEDEVQAMVAKQAERMEQRKRQAEEIDNPTDDVPDAQDESETGREELDQEAVRYLLGGNKAKRSRTDNIQIIDLSAAEVMPNRDEWVRKTLAGETSYIPTGQILEKGPNALAKRKHQISFLSMRAENNEAELEAMWAANRQTKREGKSKYGF